MSEEPKKSKMRIFIAGGSGAIGLELAKSLLDDGHEPIILSRNADAVRRRREMWPFRIIPGDPRQPGRWQDELDGCDAVVNLAGHNIFADRWTSEIKRKLRDSRVHGAEQLSAAIEQAHERPRDLVQGSAVGFYGPRGDEEIDESGSSGSDLLAVICRECEEASAGLPQLGVRRVVVRTGIVLAPDSEALKVMTPLFKFGPGTPVGAAGKFLGSGQPVDELDSHRRHRGAVSVSARELERSGPLNGTAPEPVRNADFARTFSSVLRTRFTPWRVYLPFGPPDALLRLMVGEVASTITKGQRVLPAKALALGYVFKYPHLVDALRRLWSSTFPQKPPSRFTLLLARIIELIDC